MTNETLIIGIGSTIRKDDAAGIIVGAGVSERIGADFLEATSVDLAIVDYLHEYRFVAIIDTIITGTDAPGTVVRHSIDNLGKHDRTKGPHRRNLPLIIDISRRSGIDVDSKLTVFTIEILVNNDFGEELSPEVSEKIPAVVEFISRELCHN